MTLMDYLIAHYPNADPLHDWAVLDVGRGQFIGAWHLDTPQPTTAELAAAGIHEGGYTMAARQSAIQEYEEKTFTNMIAPARTIIINMSETDLLSLTNGIPQMVKAAGAGQVVGDSTLIKERAEAISTLSEMFRQFLALNMPTDAGFALAYVDASKAPKAQDGLSPLVVIMQRD